MFFSCQRMMKCTNNIFKRCTHTHFTSNNFLEKFYLSGVGVVASVVFVGNVYNGFEMAHVCDGSEFVIIEGFYFGFFKACLYGISSWTFPVYATYRHMKRHEIAKKTKYPKILTAHIMMHLIPMSLLKCKLTYNKDATKFFVDKGI